MNLVKLERSHTGPDFPQKVVDEGKSPYLFQKIHVGNSGEWQKERCSIRKVGGVVLILEYIMFDLAFFFCNLIILNIFHDSKISETHPL